MDEEKLIMEVQNHPVVYDPSHPFYKDNIKKEAAWKAISEAMGVDADLCKTKWRSLRDSFVKSRKKVIASGSAGGSQSQKDWKYTDIMSFLLPHLQQRSSRSSLSTALAEGERSSTPVSTCGSDEQTSSTISMPPVCASPTPSTSTAPAFSEAPTVSAAQSVPGPSTSVPHRSRSPRERAGRSDTRRSNRAGQSSDLEVRLLDILEEPISKPSNDIDECYHFAMSLIPQLHRMDQRKRRHAKIAILNVLDNIESSPTPTSTQPSPHPTYSHSLPPTTHFAPQQRQSSFTHPPPVNPIGPFTQMLASQDDLQWGESSSSTPYTDL